MDEARKLDHLLLELRSVTGKIKADNIISMYPMKSLQDERRELLTKLVESDFVDCSSDVFDDSSEIWLTEDGLQFIMNGGYRKRKNTDQNKEGRDVKKQVFTILLYTVPIIFLIILLLILFEVITF